MSGLFKPTKEKIDYGIAPEAKGERTGRRYLQNVLGQPYQPYAGQRVAGVSPYEAQGLESLGAFMDRPVSPLYGASQTELMKTLTGEYDPTTSPFYQATRTGMQTELDKAIAGMRQSANIGGQLYSGARETREDVMRGETGTELARLLGGMAETERGRRLGAVPLAMQAGQFLEEAPLRTTQAAQQYGALPRELEQKELDAAYEEFIRKYQDPFMKSDLARILMGQQQTMMPQYQYGQSPWQQFVGPASQVATAALL